MIQERDRWLSDLNRYVGQERIDFTEGYIPLNTSPVDLAFISNPKINTANYSHTVVECKEGDVFTVTGDGGLEPRLYGFLAIDGTILDVADESFGAEDRIITAPENAAMLVVNSRSGVEKVYRGYLPKQLNDNTDNNDMCGCTLSFLERSVFRGIRRNLAVGANANYRKAEVVLNHLYSKGHEALTGSTYYGINMTGTRRPTVFSNLTAGSRVFYRDTFSDIPKVVTGFDKLYVRSSRYMSPASSSDRVDLYFMTYDENDDIYYKLIPMTSDGYADTWYLLDPRVLQNGNLAIFVQFRNPKPTLDIRFNIELQTNAKPDASSLDMTMTALGKKVQDS